MKTGIVVVDLQNEYLPAGKLPLSGIEAAVASARRVIDHARSTGLPVFHIRHESDDNAAGFFIKGSHGVETQPAVSPTGEEAVIVKNHINAFRETELKKQLDARGIQRLVIVGAMSHMCIDAVTRAAHDFGYSCAVAHDACATLALEFNGVSVPASKVHAAYMAALAFAYAKVDTTDALLGDLA